MKITKKSSISGVIHSMDLDITPEQLQRWNTGEKIQNVFPRLTADEREFLMTGITPEEWAETFSGEK
jgi:hypothetical protein